MRKHLLRFCLLGLLAAPVWADPIHQMVRDNELTQVQDLLVAEKAAGPEEGVEPLLTRRQDGATPLLVAAFVGNTKMADLLLTYGADIEAQDLLGDTPLFRAFSEDHTELALDLIGKGADLNKANKVGETSFMMAARSADVTTLKKVLATGKGEMEKADGRGRTALHHAVEMKSLPNVELLLASGAAVNAVDKKGSTVLQKAVAMGDMELAIALLQNGADPQIKDSWGRTAARIALERRDTPMVNLLEQGPPPKPEPKAKAKSEEAAPASTEATAEPSPEEESSGE
jgi:ankyrin repeat protein